MRQGIRTYFDRSHKERGAVLYLGMLIVPIIITLSLVMFQIGFSSMTRGDLERIADAAGSAAGSAIGAPSYESAQYEPCLSTECWEACRADPSGPR